MRSFPKAAYAVFGVFDCRQERGVWHEYGQPLVFESLPPLPSIAGSVSRVYVTRSSCI